MRFYPVPARTGIYTTAHAPVKVKTTAQKQAAQGQQAALSNQQAQQIIDLFEPVIR